jgi:hypothetical protein
MSDFAAFRAGRDGGGGPPGDWEPGWKEGPIVQYDIGVSFLDMTSASALLYDIGVSSAAYDISVS